MARRSLKEFRESKPTVAPSTVTPSGRKSLSEYRESLEPKVEYKEFITPYAKTVQALKQPVKEEKKPTRLAVPKTSITKVKEQSEQLKKMATASTRSVMAFRAAEKAEKEAAKKAKPTYLERAATGVQKALEPVTSALGKIQTPGEMIFGETEPTPIVPLGTRIGQLGPERIFPGTDTGQFLTGHTSAGPGLERLLGRPTRAADVESIPGQYGQILQSILPGAMAERGVRALTGLPKAVQTIGRLTAGGIGSQAALEAMGGKGKTAEESLRDIGIAGALGGGIGALGTGVSALGRAGTRAVLKPTLKAATQGIDQVLPSTALRGAGTAPVRQSLQQFREGVQPSLATEEAVSTVSQAPVRKSVQEFREPAPIQREEIPFEMDDDEWTALQDVLGESDQVDRMVSPGLRQRLTTTADDMIASAKQQWAAKQNIGFAAKIEDPDVAILTKMAAGYMLKGTLKLADVTEAFVRELGEGVRPYVRAAWEKAKPVYKDLKTKSEAQDMGMGEFSPIALKDRSNLLLNTTDVYRNFERVFGKHLPEVKKNILDPFDIAKDRAVQMQKDQLEEMATVMKELGIKKGSKESALVQQYGEKRITLEQLKAASPKWEQIVKADRYFRSKYDTLIDRVNNTVRQIYPNSPDKIVPKRADYYRHFREQGDIAAFKALFQTSAGIDPLLSGISPHTQPKTKWASFKQKRSKGEFKDDAVGGFIDYLPAAAIATHIDPQISVFRNLAKNLAQQTQKTANINNFIAYLHDFANDLAGKTSPFDRWIEKAGNRNTLRVLQWMSNRVKKNVILGNLGSVLAQTASMPAGAAFAKQHAIPAVADTMKSFVRPSGPMSQSKFLKERYLGKDFRQFDTRWFEQPQKGASWLIDLSDRVGTSFVWNGAYRRGVAEGVPNPIQYADENTRKLVTGRGAGEQPLLYKSKVGQIALPFMLEVGNLWHVMKDFVRAKDFGGIAILFGANFLLNRVMEQTRGTPVTFDPIDAIYDALKEEDASPFERGGRIAGELISSVPGGAYAGALFYPEYGFDILGYKAPSREQFFGSRDPTRFGLSPLVTKSWQDPLFNLFSPFGGTQLKKTAKGIESLIKEGVYKGGMFAPSEELKYPVERKPSDISRALLFGPTATSTGKRYYKEEQRPLSEKQTREFKGAPSQAVFFENLQKQRQEATERLKRKRELKAK